MAKSNAVADAPVPAAEPPREELLSELERLRREVALLRAGHMPGGLDAQRGKIRTYRVKLKGVISCLTSRSVGPRPAAPAPLATYPILTLKDLDLFHNEAGHDTLKIEQAAWERYVRETNARPPTDGRALDLVKDKRAFTVTVEHGPQVDHLDILAASPADAFDLFCRLHQIMSTTQKPEVVALPEADAEATGVAAGNLA
jgi:hypothetical protein